MSVDINQDLKDLSNKVVVYQAYNEFKTTYDDLKKKSGSSYEENDKYLKKLLSNFDRTNRKSKDNSCKPFLFSLLEQLKKLRGSGKSTDQFTKRLFIDTLKELKGDLVDILTDLFITELNCDINTEYQFNTAYYIPVESIDLFNILQTSPEDKIGKLFYETKSTPYSLYVSNPTVYPYSMNRELYRRTQNLNQTFSSVEGNNYIGTSTQNLFDISYVDSYLDPITNQTVQGSFFKVELKPRQNFGSPDQYIIDYLTSIDVLEFKSFFTYLSNFATGAISYGQNDGKLKISSIQKSLAINKRISCLCADSTKEIDVAGTSKISEIDNVDESFFELTDVELRIIEQNTSDIKLGVVEFEDCENIKVPMNLDALLASLDALQFNEDTDDVNEYQNAMDVINPTVDETFGPSINQAYLEQFINAIVASLLSPKILLPFMTMFYATKQQVLPQIKSFEDFIKVFRTLYINLFTKILSKFTKKVFDQLKKQIIRLVTLLNLDITKEKKQKIQDMVLNIVALLANPINTILDFRECKASLDDLMKLLNAGVVKNIKNELATSGLIPLPLLLSSRLLDGYSPTRSFLNTIENLQSIGVPTGPMPDGSPNKFVASIKAMIDGNSKEISQNGKVAIGVGPLTTLPTGLTIPKDAYGKFI